MARNTPLWLQAGQYPAAWDRRLIGLLFPTSRISGMAVTPAASGLVVNIGSGIGAIQSPNNTGSAVCVTDGVGESVTLQVAPSSNSRIDSIICQPRGSDWDGTSNCDFVFAAVTGTAAASPTPPSIPSGTALLANVTVGTNVTNLVAGNISDQRPLMYGPQAAGAHCRAGRNAAFSLLTGAGTPVLFDNPTEDPLGMCPQSGTQNGELVLPCAGRWLITGSVQVTGTGSTTGANLQLKRRPGNTLVLGGAVIFPTYQLGASAGSNAMPFSFTYIETIPGTSIQVCATGVSVAIVGVPGTLYTWAAADYLGP